MYVSEISAVISSWADIFLVVLARLARPLKM